MTLSLDRGGTERHIAEIMPRLAANGWPIALFCIGTRGEMADAVAAKGVTVITPPMGSGARFSGPLQGVRQGLAALGLAAELLRRRPTIIHFFLPGPYLIGGPLANLLRIPVRIMSRRSLNHYMAKRPTARRLELALHPRMTALLANSRPVVAELIDDEACDPRRVGLIYNGIDIAPFEAPAVRAGVREKLGLSDAHVVITVLANLIAYKGHRDLIEALARVKDKLPNPWIVLCAGRDDGIQHDLEALAATHGLAEHVRFLGSRADTAELLRASDLGLLCSHEEGFSNAVIESMAAGLPMIVTKVGGNAEAVRDGVDGFVVPAKNPAALGVALVDLLSDPPRAKAMGTSGAARARQHFSIEACVARYEAVYRALLTGRQADEAAPHGHVPGRN